MCWQAARWDPSPMLAMARVGPMGKEPPPNHAGWRETRTDTWTSIGVHDSCLFEYPEAPRPMSTAPHMINGSLQLSLHLTSRYPGSLISPATAMPATRGWVRVRAIEMGKEGASLGHTLSSVLHTLARKPST